MKKINIRILIVSIVILIIGSSLGAAGVSALTPEGESLLSNLAQAGSVTIDLGINKTTTVPAGYSEGAQADLAAFLKKINFDYDEMKIIDLTDYVINRKGTFEKWIQINYGADIEVPASVRSMSSSELVIFLMSNKFDPDFTISTTTRYVFDDSEEETTTAVTEDDSADESFPDEELSKNENAPELKKGDVNGDGSVTAGDARIALRASAKLTTLDSAQKYVADVTGDGFVTAKDARMILRYSAKLITSF